MMSGFSGIARGIQSLWKRARFELKLTTALVLVVGVAISMGLHAHRTARSAHDLFERSRLAHEVLYQLGGIARQHKSLLQLLSQSLVTDTDGRHRETHFAQEAVKLNEIKSSISLIKKAVMAEIAFVGNATDENEKEELERIVKLETELAELKRRYEAFAEVRRAGPKSSAASELVMLLDSALIRNIEQLINDGVEDEQAEVARSDARAHALLHEAENITIIALGLTMIFGFVIVLVLVSTVRRPLAALREGMAAFSRDELQHRIKIDGADEFAELAASFNAMAAERELRRNSLLATASELKAAAADRTRELIAANARLAEIDSSRRRFLADISHELRTPLTIIRGESEVALRGADKDVSDYKSALQRILEEASHTGVLVDDLLFLARREAGDIRLHVQPVMIGQLAERVCQEVSSMAAPKRLQVRLESALGSTRLWADAARMRQLLLICLDNAIRYSLPDTEIEVRLTADTDTVRVTIVDHGIGITEAELPNVFTRFYRGARAEKYDAQGTGLGLPMAKAIVDAHDGRIEVSSKPDRGTRVDILLPLQSETKELT